jgi:glycosyltransferase involved in cell wall biosynthesis
MERVAGRRLRICLIASSRFPIREPFAGGMESHTHLLARSLQQRGHQVALFAAPGSDPCLQAEEIPVPRFSGRSSGRPDVGALPAEWMQEHHAYLGVMLALLGARARDFDVIHNNSLHHLPVAMSPMLPVPLLTTLHTPPTPWLESAEAFAGAAARFVAVSAATAVAWQPYVPATVVRNGVDLAAWRPGPGGPDAVWTGRIAPEKAPHLAVQAALMAGMAIDLAGPVMDEAYFRRELKPLLSSTVRYHGHLSREGMHALVSRARVAVVSPVWDEPYGLVAAEAMACGTPVAAFRRGGLPEVVAAESGRLAPAEDTAALAEAIVAASQLDRAGVRRYAERHCSSQRMVEEYEQAYEATIDAGGRAPSPAFPVAEARGET